MDALGAAIEQRMQFSAAHIVATLHPGVSLTITSDVPVTVPVTGIAAGDAETSGDQTTARIAVRAGVPATLDLMSNASALPDGWRHEDIGAVGVPGGASHDRATESYTVRGAGADVWGTADAFHFAYRLLSGDAQITARVAAVQNTDAWTKAGVMIRGTTAANAPHAFMLVSSGRGLAFQRRASAGGSTTSTAAAAAAAPYWVRLEHRGDVMTAYQSADGTDWKRVGSATIVYGRDVLIGLAVSSHRTTDAAAATFDHVAVASLAPVTERLRDLPAPWSHQDVGAAGAAGGASYDNAASHVTIQK